MQKNVALSILLIALLVSLACQKCVAATPPELAPYVDKLTHVKLKHTAELIDEMSRVQHPELVDIYTTMLNGQLYYHKQERFLVKLIKNGDGDHLAFPFFEPVNDGSEQVVKKSAFKKIRVNNKLRTKLRESIAILHINSNDPEQRKQAATTLIGSVTPVIRESLATRLLVENNKAVKQAIRLTLAIDNLNRDISEQQTLEAVNTLALSLHPSAKNALNTLVENSESEQVVNTAKNALNSINRKTEFYGLVEQLFFGLSLGSVLLLAAIGLSITFGVMGVINMAHGEMIMLGAYTTYSIQLLMPNHIGISILIAIPAAFCVSGLVGILIERGVIQFLKGRPLETLLATFGISLVLQQLVRSVYSPLNRQVITPEWMSGSLVINDVFSITYNRLYILIFALIVFVALQALLRFSKIGLNVRAVSQNRAMARAMGIKAERVDALTFGLGSGVAGVAGVALSQLTNVGPNLGQSYIIDSFMVVVFGGVGNLYGTLIGSFTLGIANKFLEPATGAVMANIILLVCIILFIQRKPQGLFPQKGRAAND